MTRWRTAALLTLAAVSAGQNAPPPARNAKGGIMEQISSATDFDVRNPTSESIERMAGRIKDSRQLGIFVLGPRSLAIDQDSDIPLAIFDHYSAPARGGQFLADTGVIVATRVESRETYAELLVEPKEPADPDEAPAPPAPVLPGRIIKRFTLTVRERLPKLPWKAGTYIVDVLMGAEASNRLRVPVSPGQAAAKDPAIADYLERHRSGEPAPSVWPLPEASATYPSYRAEADTPRIPAAPGIQLAAERVQVARPENRSILRGSFRVTVPPRYLVKNQGESRVTAVVPITLVMVGNISAGPSVVRLFVPSTDRVTSDQESQVTGVFNIDLFRFPNTSKHPQTYTVYAYCGEVRSASVTMAYVTPDMLRE